MNMQGLQVPLGKEGAEKTARSIFVGNIPYEATEEKLVELFSKAGPVQSFRLVYDRESGKPKGYGFCEYNNPAIAASALRNLHNIDFNGRPLRIGPAAGEQNSAEIALTNPSVGPPLENPYGNAVDPAKAPEAISRAVASLPPEQMYELMKQMKLCIQNNPNEARNMLLQNPQLAYALLQAQIVMKIVDPKVAIAMLNRSHDQIPPARPDNSSQMSNQPQPSGDIINSSAAEIGMPQLAPVVSVTSNSGQFMGQPGFGNDYPQPPMQQDSKGMPPGMYHQGFQPPPPSGPPNQGPPSFHHHAHHQHHQQTAPPTSMAGGSHFGPPGQPQMLPPGLPHGLPSLDHMNPAIAAAAAIMGGAGSGLGGGANLAKKEQEKVELIMQVLSLSEASIEMLPEDQQRSIRVLKEQVRKTGVF